jgi:hypothetical protein
MVGFSQAPSRSAEPTAANRMVDLIGSAFQEQECVDLLVHREVRARCRRVGTLPRRA